ncbi:uncharacterized protein LOC135483422 [Lineus longissimus]|uniref:uncharacterized protein LOC135483422 n=1 Tax=Lineus longissimus TaxID=88925 RepID=UPI00315D2708
MPPLLRASRPAPTPTSRQPGRQEDNGRPGFAHEKTLVLGVIQLLAGVASIILATVTIAAMAWGYFVGTGVWSGIFFMASGIVGIITSKRKDNCMIISFMVLSIISAGVSAILCGFSIAGLFIDHLEVEAGKVPKENVVQVMVVHSLVLLIGLIEGICAIVSAVICCRAVCCGVYDSAYQPGRLAPGGNPDVRYFPNRLSGAGLAGDQQPIALITPTSSSQQSGLFSFHGAYIIQPAEVNNQQVMYMLPAPGSYAPIHPAPPPPYSSTDALDSDRISTAPPVSTIGNLTQSVASHPTTTNTTSSRSATLPHQPAQERPRPTSRHISTSTSSINRVVTQDNTVTSTTASTTCNISNENNSTHSHQSSEELNNARNQSHDGSPEVTISLEQENEEDKP